MYHIKFLLLECTNLFLNPISTELTVYYHNKPYTMFQIVYNYVYNPKKITFTSFSSILNFEIHFETCTLSSNMRFLLKNSFPSHTII